MVRWLGWWILALGLGLGACSDPAPKPGTAITMGTPPGASGGGGGGDGGPATAGDSGTDGGVCTELLLTGSLIDRTAVQGDPPVSTGGTVVDGIYDLSLYSVYVGASGVAGPTGITTKATLQITAGKIDEVIELGGTGKTNTTTSSRSAYSASGVTFAQTQLCPTTGAGKQVQFTAVDATLTFTDLTTKETFTFTKR